MEKFQHTITSILGILLTLTLLVFYKGLQEKLQKLLQQSLEIPYLT